MKREEAGAYWRHFENKRERDAGTMWIIAGKSLAGHQTQVQEGVASETRFG